MSLTKDDLIKKCEACGGVGAIYDPPRDPNQGTYGRQVIMQHQSQCAACRGIGEVLTEEGKAVASVVALMRRRNDL